MEKVAIDDVDSWQGPAAEKRPVGRALGVEDAAINYYELEPGEAFAFGAHQHENQEEVFYVREGAVTFEVGDPRETTEQVRVEAGELIRFAPGEWQCGYNTDTERVSALAVGAPATTGETTILRPCPTCEELTPQDVGRPDDDETALVTTCTACDTETGRFS